MIKTWLIPIVVSTIIMVSLLTVNLMVLSGSILLEGFLRQKARAILADSLINDILNSVENIVNTSMCSSKGNFSELKKILVDEMRQFWEAILYKEERFNEYGVSIRFDYSIEIREEGCSVEIVSRIRARDLEGFFTLERVHNTVRRLASEEVGNDSTG